MARQTAVRTGASQAKKGDTVAVPLTAEVAVVKAMHLVIGETYVNKKGVTVTKDGAHVVFDGINDMLKKYFGMTEKQQRVDFINDMADRNLIDVAQVKGGAKIYPAGKMPARTDSHAKADSLFSRISK